MSGRLAHVGLLRFSGPDALSFLQGQISNDTRRLAAGSPLLAAYSSPQGRVLAVMHLLPHSTGVIAILPRELLSPTLERLRKFVLRAKVRIDEAADELCVAGQQGTQSLESAGILVPPPDAGYSEQDGIAVGLVTRGSNRYWVVGAAAQLAQRGLAGDPSCARQIERDWRLADIRAGLPQVYAATQELFVAQMLNLDLIDGISFSKGCFTGQEIIARTQHLGRIKRRMFRLQLPPGEWRIGQSLRLADGRAGRLTELAPIGEGFEALAVLNIDGTTAEIPTAESAASSMSAASTAATASVASAASTASVTSTATAVATRELPLPYPAQPQ